MKQGTLFDPVSAKPLRRRTDPETSREAARDVAPVLSDVQQRLVDFPRGRDEPFTARELAEFYGRLDGRHDMETYRKRVREIEQKGVFVECPKRPCQFTDKNATTFKLRTGNV